MKKALDFAVIGGDMRIIKLAECLSEDGYKVKLFGAEKTEIPKKIELVETIDELGSPDCIILPLPATDGTGYINMPLSDEKLKVCDMLETVKKGTVICGGLIPDYVYALCSQADVIVRDYFKREELTVTNAAVTAEGAIQLIMEETPTTINGTKCLVIGYGRIGKFLSGKLRSLGADVTVCARKASDKAWVQGWGMHYVPISEMDTVLSKYSVVVNTVPSLVMNAKRLSLLQHGCFALDLASKPGGFDFIAAASMGVPVMWALSLPGKIAPETAGYAIKDAIMNILEEGGNGVCG